MYFTLFVCKCPIRCHLTGFTASYFLTISCTLFSPISVTPRFIASFITSGPCVFVTATSVISSAFLPALSAASFYPFAYIFKAFFNSDISFHPFLYFSPREQFYRRLLEICVPLRLNNNHIPVSSFLFKTLHSLKICESPLCTMTPFLPSFTQTADIGIS